MRSATERSGSTVVVVGGGPAGLSAAIGLRAAGVGHVVLLEREQQAGGIPRHTDHLGYGVRDLHRLLRGPAYAARLVADARRAGVDVREGTTVLDVTGASVIAADGITIAADAVVVATGVRERPRSARLVPGDRPRGVFTTGSVQQLTALHHRHIGERAVIVGAEHVSFSAIWTLRHGGCTPVAMLTPLTRHQTYLPLRIAAATRHRVPIHAGVDIAEIVGRGRVREVVLTDGRRLACDTVLFTGDWIPEHEVIRRAGAAMVRGSRAPLIDGGFRTSVSGVFAIGNLVHPAETADVCALDGRAVASAVVSWLGRSTAWGLPSEIIVDDPIRWATHTAGGLTVRVDEFARGRIVVRRDGEVLTRTRLRTWVPNRAIHISLPNDTTADPSDTADRSLSITLVR